MSVAVLTPLQLEKYEWLAPEEQFETKDDDAAVALVDEEDRPGQLDVWSAIQAQKAANLIAAADPPAPYAHPLVRRSSSSLSQKSLQICTESLGSETGSDDFSSLRDQLDLEYMPQIETENEEENHDMKLDVEHLPKIETQKNHDMQDEAVVTEGVGFKKETERRQVPQRKGSKELTSVNYRCSISSKSPPRSFPPPLPSISRRDGPCLHMRPHRRDGHLVVDAVPVRSKNYLHTQREDGRLLLSFIDAISSDLSFNEAASDAMESQQTQEQHQPIDEEMNEIEENAAAKIAYLEEEELEEKNCYEYEDEEEEEVEVVDRGTVVEVKVSTQPQQPNGGAMKVLRSSLVINKFVGGTPLSSKARCELPAADETGNTDLNNISQQQATAAAPMARRPPPTTATTAAAVVVASNLSASAEAYNEHSNGGARLPFGNDEGLHLPLDNKLLFTSKRRNREELLHSMRRCSQLRRPLFIWEPYCIATTT